MLRGRRGIEFVYTPVFLASAEGLLDEEALRQAELALLAEPRLGDVIAETGGVRKMRVPLPGRGKRGGGRVIYLFVDGRGTVYFLLAYGKNQQVDLTPAQRKHLRALAKVLREES